jgi:glucose-1-phosphate cytidylyltransferase
MKVVILAGGLGTRLSEETELKPKPMVEIGGRPILWHIMKIYSHYNFNEFVICCGYKGYVIKEYFANYFLHQADVTIDLVRNNLEIHSSKAEPWKITLVDTGLNTMTGSRIRKVRKYLNEERFMLTYGDGLADINLVDLVKYHEEHRKIATLTTVQPSGKFGSVILGNNDLVSSFQEKPKGDGAWINGGFFVLEPEVFKYIDDTDDCIWEKKPLESLALDCQLMAYRHTGFWRPMDTLRDKVDLEGMWNSNNCNWRLW